MEYKQEHSNPFIFRTPVRGNDFFGRDDLLNQLFHYIDTEQSVSLVGERRIGKTSTLLRVLDLKEQRLSQPRQHIFVLLDFLGLGYDTETDIWVTLLAALKEEMVRAKLEMRTITNTIEQLQSGEFILQTLLRFFRTLADNRIRVTFLFDEFEATVKEGSPVDLSFYKVLRNLATDKGTKLTYVIATRQALSDVEKTLEREFTSLSSPLFNIFHQLVIPPFSEKEARQMVSGLLRRTGLEPDAKLSFWLQRDLLFKLSGFHPLFLQMACYQLFEHCVLEGGTFADRIPEDEIVSAFLLKASEEFKYYWAISSPGERWLMRQLATNVASLDLRTSPPVVSSLKNRCLIVKDERAESKWRPFSIAFAKWIEQRPSLIKEQQPSLITRSNPFIYGRPVRPDEFLDREAELRTIFNRLRNSESTAVVGEPHIGKTSLLLKLANEETQQAYLGNDARYLVVSLLDLHPIGNEYTPTSFWEEALEPLQERPGHRAVTHCLEQAAYAGYARRPLERLFNTLSQREQWLVLLLDEFERLLIHPNFQSPAFFALLRSLASHTGGLVLVTASRLSVAEMSERARHLMTVGSPFFNIMIDTRLRLFGERDVDELLNRAGDAFSSDDRRFIRRVAGRHPFLLQTMAAALIETIGDDIQARAAESFCELVAFHFDVLWHSMDDRMRTTSVVLGLMELGSRTLGQDFAYGEIESVDAFGPELRKLAERGLAEQVGEDWQFDWEHLVLWRGERWTVSTQALVWWVRDVVVAESRRVPAYDGWLANQGYRSLLTQEQWERLLTTARGAPEWAMRGVGALAKALFEELVRR